MGAIVTTDNVVLLFEELLSQIPEPEKTRADIVAMLQMFADKAARGEIEALFIGCTMRDGSVGSGLSTPENAPYMLLGLLEEIKDQIKEELPSRQPTGDWE